MLPRPMPKVAMHVPDQTLVSLGVVPTNIWYKGMSSSVYKSCTKLCAQKIDQHVVVLADGEPEYDREARNKLAAAGLTSDEEEEGHGGASGYDTDSQQAEAGGDAERPASKGHKSRKRKEKPSRSRSKSRERGAKGTPRLKKRAREPGQCLLVAVTLSDADEFCL